MTNTIGIHALVWTGTWDEAACRSAMQRTRAAGYDLLEVPLLDPSSVDPEQVRQCAEEHDLSVSFSTGLSPETDISSTDPAVVRAGAALLDQSLDVVARAGASFLGGVVHSAMTKYTQLPTAAGRANAVAVLRDLGQRAQEQGVAIGLEVVNRYESNLLNTAEQALAFIEEVDSDALTVHLDTYHMHIEERDLVEPVHRCADAGRLGYVHVGESDRGYLGSGSVALPELFRALHDVGYEGPIVFESFSSAVVSEAFTAALGIWRDPWRDGDDLAAHARQAIDVYQRAVTQ